MRALGFPVLFDARISIAGKALTSIVGAQLLVCLLVWSSVAAQPAAPAEAASSKVSRQWKRLVTPSLVVVGNARAGDLERTAEEIERFRAAIRALTPNFPLDSAVPTVAVVFRDDHALTRFKPRSARGKRRDDVAAYFWPLPEVNYIVLAPTGNREFTYQLIFHEYTHLLVNRSAPGVPLWLNEGLAEFYSTFGGSERDGRAVIGRPIPRHVMALGGFGFIPLKKLLDPGSLVDLLRDAESTARFYAESWALTHYLLLGQNGRHRPRLQEFVAAMREGQPPDTAFTRVFGEDLEGLGRELRHYVSLAQMPGILVPKMDVSLDRPIEPLLEVEAEYVQGDLLVRLGDFEEGEKHLARALALDATHVLARLSRARSLTMQERASEALELLDAPDLRTEQGFDAVFTRANTLRQARRFEDAMAAYRQAIAVRPDAPWPYYGLSVSQMALGHAGASASFSRCTQIQPDPDWYHSRLHEAQRLGIDTFAVSDAVSFVKQAGWQNSSSPYVMYIAALAWMRKNLPDRAAETLREIDAHVEADSWQAAIAAFLAGRLTPEAFLAKASPKELLTEAHAYIGIKASIEGDRERARRHLTWVKEKGLRNYTEYRLALGELERIESKPDGSRP